MVALAEPPIDPLQLTRFLITAEQSGAAVDLVFSKADLGGPVLLQPLLHQHHAGWTPWAGELPHRTGGAMIADRIGTTTAYALDNLQLRGTLFLSPGEEVYEGMVIGEGARGEEMVVNAVRAKEKTNIRTHSHDDGVKLAAPVVHTLETAIEWIGDDELVEVTPTKIRIRKRMLGLEDRRRAFKKQNS